MATTSPANALICSRRYSQTSLQPWAKPKATTHSTAGRTQDSTVTISTAPVMELPPVEFSGKFNLQRTYTDAQIQTTQRASSDEGDPERASGFRRHLSQP